MNARIACVLGLSLAICTSTGCDRADRPPQSSSTVQVESPPSETRHAEAPPADDERYALQVRIPQDPKGDSILRAATLAEFSHDKAVVSIAYSPDGLLLAVRIRKGNIILWNTETKEKVASTQLAGGRIWFSPIGRTLVARGEDYEFLLLNVPELTPKATFKDDNHTFSSLVISPDGKYMALSKINRRVVIWNLQTQQVARQLRFDEPIPRQARFALAYSPDGKTLATSAEKGSVALYDTTTWKIRARLHPEQPTYRLDFSPDGRMLATGALQDRRREGDILSTKLAIQLWDPATGKPILVPTDKNGDGVLEDPPANPIPMRDTGVEVYVRFSPSGRVLISRGGGMNFGREMKFWDVATQRKLRTVRLPEGSSLPFFSPDGKTAAMITGRTKVHILDLTILLPEEFE